MAIEAGLQHLAWLASVAAAEPQLRSAALQARVEVQPSQRGWVTQLLLAVQPRHQVQAQAGHPHVQHGLQENMGVSSSLLGSTHA